MCNDLRRSKRKTAIIFKIVAKKPKGTRYYSIAMGFKYPKVGTIPEVTTQCCLGYFHGRLLTVQYKSAMVGRTAGFIRKFHAEGLASSIRRSLKHYTILVVKAKLTKGLMLGDYERDPIIAGRHIEFLDD